MRIGLNLLYLVPGAVGGSEVYAKGLLGALAARDHAPELVAYVGPEAHEALGAEPWATGIELVRAPVPSRAKPLRLAEELSWLPVRARRDGIDLIHSLGTTNPIVATQPTVVTVLDVIYHHFPSTFPAASRLGLRMLVPAGARRAARVIAISAAAKEDISQVLGLDRSRVDVVHLGPGQPPTADPAPEAEVRGRHDLGDAPVILAVAAALEHKNLPRLLEAFAAMETGPVMVVVGHAGLETERLQARAAELGVGERVRFTGWIPGEELEGLYRLASAFAYPTLIEGFGMPVLEAMRRRVPVACSDIPVLHEIADAAAEYFDPADANAIARSLERLVGDPALRDALAQAGDRRWREFSWERCAQETLGVYERATATIA